MTYTTTPKIAKFSVSELSLHSVSRTSASYSVSFSSTAADRTVDGRVEAGVRRLSGEEQTRVFLARHRDAEVDVAEGLPVAVDRPERVGASGVWVGSPRRPGDDKTQTTDYSICITSNEYNVLKGLSECVE